MQQAEYYAHQSLAFKICCTLFSIMILGYKELGIVTGIVSLSPMTVAPVCHVGDPLQIMCTASVEFIRWNIFRVNKQGILEMATNDELINSRDASQMAQTVVDSTTFTFTRMSDQFASPLISTLSIDSVSIGLNGTVVRCMEAGNMMVSASTTIQIIDTSQNIQYTPILNSTAKEYSANNVTVIVEWDQQTGVMYTVKVSQMVPAINFTNTRYLLTIPYNSTYNFSVIATTPCRPNTTAVITLKYAYCGPPELLLTESNDSVPTVVGYVDRTPWPIEGSIVMISCPPGLEVTGSNLATCSENGEWEPDPSQLICTASSSEGLEGEKIGESRSTNVLIVTVSSLVVGFLIISLLIFIIGFVCGHYFGQKYKQSSSSLINQPVALYEDVNVLPSAVEYQEQHLELRENVAYCPSKLNQRP